MLDEQLRVTPRQLEELLKIALVANKPVMVTGPPGIGKTDIVKQVAEDLDFLLITKIAVIDSPIDYKGLGFKVEGKDYADFLPFGDLLKLIEADRPVVCFLDDVGQAPSAVQAALMQMVLARQAGTRKISDQVRFVAATNRLQDMAGVSMVLSALRSRFKSILELWPDHNDWIRWAVLAGMPPELIAFIKFKPDMLIDPEPPKNDVRNFRCPRTVAAVGEWMNLNIPHEVEFQVFAGAAGVDFSMEFVGFLKMARKLVDPALVFLQPETVPIPDDVAAQTTLCSTLAMLVERDKAEAFFRFARRLPVELASFMTQTAIHKKPEIQETRPYIEWASEVHFENAI